MEQVQDTLIGREAEIKYLETIVSSKEAEFVVVYGRRRVGKTFLVNTYFNDKYAFKLTGLAKKGKREQLANFTTSLNRYANGKKYTKPRTWYEAFDELRDLLETVQPDGKRVIFIDELPWMDTARSGFKGALDYFWNSWGSSRTDLLLIVCGSATSWIIKHILADTR